MPVLWRGKGTGIPHCISTDLMTSQRDAQGRQQGRWASRWRKKPWGLGEWADQRGGRQELRKPRSNWGKYQCHFCFDGSCNCSISFHLWLPPPTFSLPWAACRDWDGSARRLLAALPAATPLSSSCLWWFTCSCTEGTELSHALLNTTPGECTKLGMGKTVFC